MDPVTAAIIAGAAEGTAGALTEKAVAAFSNLKRVIKRKSGRDSKVMKAIADYESEPDFEPYQVGLQHRVQAGGFDKDPDILAAARALKRLLGQDKTEVRSNTSQQTALGKNIAQSDRGGISSVTIGGGKE